MRTEHYLSTSCQGGPHLSGRTHWGCWIGLAPGWYTHCHLQASHKNLLKKTVTIAIRPLALKHNFMPKSQFLLVSLIKLWVRGEAVTEKLNFNKAGQLYCIPQVTDKWSNDRFGKKEILREKSASLPCCPP